MNRTVPADLSRIGAVTSFFAYSTTSVRARALAKSLACAGMVALADHSLDESAVCEPSSSTSNDGPVASEPVTTGRATNLGPGT